ncbi:MAG: hypothetical protein M1816_006051 [Peltula sp. TS41687]|nr:MAG: hypothetical protein M1816_006051 [Peltula sp. TS41687]
MLSIAILTFLIPILVTATPTPQTPNHGTLTTLLPSPHPICPQSFWNKADFPTCEITRGRPYPSCGPGCYDPAIYRCVETDAAKPLGSASSSAAAAAASSLLKSRLGLDPTKQHVLKPRSQSRCTLARTPYTLIASLHAKADGGGQSAELLYAKLLQAAEIYRQDPETIHWFVMRDISDPNAFTVVERYVAESSQQFHLGNPFWRTFNPYVDPLLDRAIELKRFHELDG